MVAKIAAFSRSTFSSLRSRNFRIYFIGQCISLAGGWMQAVAQSWLILHLTGSAAALGVVAALQYGPTLIFGPYAGVLADRFSKRRLLALTQGVSGLLALLLALAVATDAAQAWMVYAFAGVLGLITALDHPTRQSFLYELTGPRELVSAVGLMGTANNLARVVGPALAGALIAASGMATCFLANAVSFAVSTTTLALMRPGEFHRHETAGERGGLAEGFSYAARTPVVRESLLMMLIIGMIVFEFSTTLPAFVKFSLGGDAAGLAVLMSAMGAGAALGGLVTAGRRGDGLGHLTITALAFGALTALVGLTPDLRSAAAVMVLVGVFSARFTGLSNGLLQLRSDPAMRNRVMALWSTAFLGSTFVGAPALGWLAESAGPRWALGVSLAGGLAAAVVGWRGMRAQRRPELGAGQTAAVRQAA